MSTNWSSVINMANSIIGVGILALPLCIKSVRSLIKFTVEDIRWIYRLHLKENAPIKLITIAISVTTQNIMAFCQGPNN